MMRSDFSLNSRSVVIMLYYRTIEFGNAGSSIMSESESIDFVECTTSDLGSTLQYRGETRRYVGTPRPEHSTIV